MRGARDGRRARRGALGHSRRSSGSWTRACRAPEIAVFYRTNAQSRVLEEMLTRARRRLPGHRRPEVLRAGRGQGRRRLPGVPGQPAGRRRRSRGSRTRRGVASGRRRCSRVLSATPTIAGDLGLGGGRAAMSRDGDRGGASTRSGGFMDDHELAEGAGRPERRPGGAAAPGRRPARVGLPRRAATPSARSKPRAGWRTCEELVSRRRSSTTSTPRTAAWASSSSRSSLFADADNDPRGRRPRDADDDAQREGAGVPDRVHDRHGGRHVPAQPLDRGEQPRRGAPARLRRASRGRCVELTLTYARRRSGLRWQRAAPTIKSRFLDEIPRELTDQPAR